MRYLRKNSKLVRLGLLSAVAAALCGVLTSSPALAADTVSSFSVAGYDVQAGASVACNKAQHTMTVSAQTTAMQAVGYFGPTDGPYDNGQYFRYRVLARDINASAWTVMYSWAPWTLIKGKYASGDYLFPSTTNFPAMSITGKAGHSYQVRFQFDWWTGKDNVVNITPAYFQAQSGYVLRSNYCQF